MIMAIGCYPCFYFMKMKTLISIAVLIIYCCNIYAQTYFETEKRDRVWLLGHYSSGGSNEPHYGGARLTFTDDTLNTGVDLREMDFDLTNASMCDLAGELLFYTNGLAIHNRNDEVMLNGDTLLPINPLNTGIDHRVPQSVIILKQPENDNIYYVFQANVDITPGVFGSNYNAISLHYSTIDMSQDSGFGAVVDKSVLLVSDTISYGKLTATRHGNGRDWWIVTQELGSNRHYRFLLDPEGVHQMADEYFGLIKNIPDVGQVAFSPDGTKYVNLVKTAGSIDTSVLRIYDFDRCSGQLSNERLFPHNDLYVVSGCAFSPNSRYLYVSDWPYIMQHDMEGDFYQPDTVAIRDSTLLPAFGFMRLGPDDKIYITTGYGSAYYSVINHPNLAGGACDVCQYCVNILNYPWFSILNAPDYRTGPLDGSPCDTLGIDMPPPVATLSPTVVSTVPIVYPNPAAGFTTVQFKEPTYGCSIYMVNILGEVVLTQPLNALMSIVYLDGLPSGVYFYSIESGGIVVGSGKVVKVE